MSGRTFIVVFIGVAVLFAALDGMGAQPAGTKFVQYPSYHDGTIAFVYKGDIWIQPPTGAARPLTWHDGVDSYPVFSPDGKWIAFSSNRTGNYDVFVIPSQGGRPKQLTFHSGSDVAVAWTPDGKKIVFKTGRSSLWGYRLFTVGMDGRLPEMYIPVRASDASISSDGLSVVHTQKSSRYTRKGYKGSCNTKIFVYEKETKRSRRLLNTDMHENHPMICGADVYYVSELSGTFNLWRVPLGGGKAAQVTTHGKNGVANPSASRDGKVIVYEHEFDIWKLDVQSGKSEMVAINLGADYREAPVDFKSFNTCDSYDVSPKGDRVVIETHGEIFTAPVDKGRVVQITDSHYRDRYPKYSPDGRKIVFVSDRSGREEVFIIDVDGKNLEKVTDIDARKHAVKWAPDGKRIAVAMSDHTLRIYDLEAKTHRVMLKLEELAPTSFLWSPDGKWIAYIKPNRDLQGDVCIASAVDENPEEHVIVEDMPLDEYLETFTTEKLFFLGETSVDDRDMALYSVSLTKETEDPDDPEVKAAKKKKKSEKGKGKKPEKKPGGEGEREKKEEGEGEKEEKAEGEEEGEKKEEKPEEKKKEEKKLPEMKIDFDRIEKRVRRLFKPVAQLRGGAVSPDGKSIVLLIREETAEKMNQVLYSYNPDAEKSKLTKLGTASDMRSLGFSPDGKKIFYLSGGRLYYRSASPGSPKSVSFSVKVKIDKAKEMSQVFHEAWRVMKHTFHDPEMHKVDWVAIRDKYAAALPSITDRTALATLINRMLGELKASHMGYYGAGRRSRRRGPSDTGISTMSPGFELEADAASGLYRVGHIYEDGPAAKDWANVSEGDYILEVDGKPLKAGENYYRLFNHALNDRVDLTLSASMDGADNRTTRIQLVSDRSVNSLRYYEWVEANREHVKKVSNGRLAYLHIPSMSRRPLARFKMELEQFRLHEGIIIDVRFNGGGNIDQQLLDVLERGYYGFSCLRGSVPVPHHRSGFFGKKCVLQNEYSFSDAEVFPAGFRDLKLGKLIGMPTGGGVIGTSSHRLMDGSSMRTPRWSYYSKDKINLENLGVQPDIKVDCTPEDQVAGRDPQLDRAIEEMMKQLPAEPPKPLERPNW